MELTGTSVVPGIAHARAMWVHRAEALEDVDLEVVVPEGDRAAEVERFEAAVTATAAAYRERAETLEDPESREILLADAKLTQDRGWLRLARKRLKAGNGSEAAVVGAMGDFIDMFTKMGGRMAERVADLSDIRDRILMALAGISPDQAAAPDGPVIVLAEELAPSDAALLDPEVVMALVLSGGGPTSHTSIVARQRGIPCLVGVSGLESVVEETLLFVDATEGRIRDDVDAVWAAAHLKAEQQRRAALQAWRGPGRTGDGHCVEILANVADAAEAIEAADTQAGGVGLFRTELAFARARREPSIDEQAEMYSKVFRAFSGRKVVVRTIDAGSDKPVPFVPHGHEENPSLGLRGIRLASLQPGIMERQLDAIAKGHALSGSAAPAWVMAPMVATLTEAEEFATAARSRGLQAGIMVEVPAVCAMASEFIDKVDFMSVGTNDLTQYVMAADRLAPELANMTVPWQPAVLRLMAMVGEACRTANKPLGVCGEAAADPLLACVLVGLGVSYLSTSAAVIPEVGVQLATVSREDCERAAAAALTSRDSDSARAAVMTILR